MRDVRSAWILCGLCLFVGCASPQPQASELEGKPMDVFHSGTESVTVLVFISNDCPIANRYVPELKRLQHQFGPRGVAF
ncbi:MAG TPA: hypothetical protein VHI52_10845, partial [Verrucomicrobiae bacterium]|nr:hypothetical protein [Verrucomicrobiae bacterium]